MSNIAVEGYPPHRTLNRCRSRFPGT